MAAELQLSEGAARRLLSSGPPRSMSEAALVKLGERVFAAAARADKARDRDGRRLLDKKRKAPVYADVARQGAVKYLVKKLRALESRRQCEPGTWSPRSHLAHELGVSSTNLRRWLEKGELPQDVMPLYAGWAEREIDRELEAQQRKAKLEDLIEKARKPVYQHGLPGQERRLAVQAPNSTTGERRTESHEQSGYEWVLRVEAWGTFPMVERLYEWARSRHKPVGMRTHPYWIVTALCTIHNHQLESPRLSRLGRFRNRRGKSAGGVRQFAAKSDKALGRELSIKVPVSSGKVARGGLERAASLFRDLLAVELCDQDLVFVHCVIVRSWRNRTLADRRAARERWFAKEDALERVKEARATARRAAAKERAKAKANEHVRRQKAPRGLGKKKR